MAKWTEEQRAKFMATMQKKYGDKKKKYRNVTKEIKPLTVNKYSDLVSVKNAKTLVKVGRFISILTGITEAEAVYQVVVHASKGK